jgi:predicted TIM-barrel fold metal-dependent hydrolase
MIIDFHVHLFQEGMDKAGAATGQLGTAEQLIENMDAAGVDKVVALPIHPRTTSEFVAAQMGRFPDRIIGFASVDPNDGPMAVDLLKRGIEELGLRGLKLHPLMQRFKDSDHELLNPLVRMAEKLDIPILFHCWARPDDPYTSVAGQVNLAQANPGVTFIMAHAGGMHFLDLLFLARPPRRWVRMENLYVDFSWFSPLIETHRPGAPLFGAFAYTLRQFGADRVLLGSDWPDTTLADAIALARQMGFEKDELELVLGENARRILKL